MELTPADRAAGGRSVPSPEAAPLPDLAPFKETIRLACGLIFDEVREARLSQALSQRMRATGQGSTAAYLALLAADGNEFERLVDDLTVNETYFFRDPQYLTLLAERLFPERLAAVDADAPVRILSAGCSTGEEPYSIVMALGERYGPAIAGRLCVIGVDIDGRTLARAAAGVYPPLSFRGCDPSLKERHFSGAGGGSLVLDPGVREQVQFARLNLLAPDYPQELSGLDVIFYRNVSIYFDRPTRGVIFGKLAALLRPGGFLVVSPSETFAHDGAGLTLIERDGLFLFQRGEPGEPGEPAPVKRTPGPSTAVSPARPRRLGAVTGPKDLPTGAAPLAGTGVTASSAPPGRAVGAPRAEPPAGDLHRQAVVLARAKRYQEAIELLVAPAGDAAARALSLSLKGAILLNLRRGEEAREAAHLAIACDRWSPEGYLILGLAARLCRDEEQAVRHFREALYVRSDCWLAHFHLAEIFRGRAERERARREYAIVLDQLGRAGATAEPLLEFFPLSFTLEQLEQLCRHHLERLQEGGA